MFRNLTRYLPQLLALCCLLIDATSSQAFVLTSEWGGRLINYDPITNTIGSVNNTLAQPTAMTIGPDGMLYMSNLATNTVDKYNPNTGSYVANVISSATLGPSFQPTGLKFGPDGQLYVASQVSYPTAIPGTGGVFKYNLTTHVLSPVVTGLTQPEGLLFNGGNLYIAELNNYSGRVLKYDFTHPASTFIANGQGGLAAATSMTVGPDGALYLTDVLGQAVRKYDFANPGINSSFAAGAGFNSPTDLAFYHGHLYVSNVGSGTAPDGFLSKFNARTGAFEGIAVPNLFYGSSVIGMPDGINDLLRDQELAFLATDSLNPVPAPEPSSLILFGGVAAAWYIRRRRKA